MKIVRANSAGFCSGVKRAIEIAEETLVENTQKHSNDDPIPAIFTLGPIVHNPAVVEHFEASGLKVVENLKDLSTRENSVVIIRTHGVGPEVFEKAKREKIRIIDATCPLVRRVQKIAINLAEDNCTPIIVGDRNHPEVQGIIAWTKGKGIVISNPAEAEKLSRYQKIGVISQTTQPESNFLETVAILQEKAEEVRIYNTICPATTDRQEAAKQLAQQVDGMVVIGGLNSANTQKLKQVCADFPIQVYLIESAADLDFSWFRGMDIVGITAGASTPEWIIEEVVTKMSELEHDGIVEEKVAEEGEKDLSASEVSCTCSECDDEQKSACVVVEETELQETTEDAEIMETMEAQMAQDMPDLRQGNIVTGKVVQVKDDEALVDVGGKSEGIIPLKELSVRNIDSALEVVQAGDEIEVYVVRAENDEGTMILSKRRADQMKAWEGLEAAFESGVELSGEVVQVVKGGLLVDVGARGFVPASLIERGYVSNLEKYLNQVLRLRVIDLDRGKNKVVLSQKAILEEEYDVARKELWESIEAGQRRQGIVRRLTNFGAFVDVGGADGLLHISEMSWTHINHPSEVVQENDEVEVFVLAVDKEKQRISLGLKQIIQSPWEQAADKYQVGEIVHGKVIRTVPFGAFVQIEPGVEGLVHISQLADYRVGRTEDVVNAGDEIPVKILDFKPQEQRMSLSLSQAREELGENVEENSEESAIDGDISDQTTEEAFEEVSEEVEENSAENTEDENF